MTAASFDPAGFPLFQDMDRIIATASNRDLGRVRFDIDGVPHDAHAETTDKYRVRITATLGYLPFSIESRERRETLLAIIAAAHALPSVRFLIDRHNKVIATGIFETDTAKSPEFLFMPLAIFHQQARPFIDVIGGYI